MTPTKRRQAIIDRIKAGAFPIYRIIRQSDYTGVQSYIDGKGASDDNIYKIEQALDRLESSKP